MFYATEDAACAACAGAERQSPQGRSCLLASPQRHMLGCLSNPLAVRRRCAEPGSRGGSLATRSEKRDTLEPRHKGCRQQALRVFAEQAVAASPSVSPLSVRHWRRRGRRRRRAASAPSSTRSRVKRSTPAATLSAWAATLPRRRVSASACGRCGRAASRSTARPAISAAASPAWCCAGLFATSGVYVNKAAVTASGGNATITTTPQMVQFGNGGG